MLYTKEQSDLLSVEECEAAIKVLYSNFPMTKPLIHMTKEEFDQVDDVAHTMCHLQDRIEKLQVIEKLAKANKARWGNSETTEPQTA
jgi:hypothetical protein